MAIFPGAVSTDSDLYIAVNQKTTQLTDNPLTAGATTANVVSTSGFPSVGFISIDAEVIHYTGITATSFTGLTRGADGTTAASHAQNSQVYHNVVAAHHNVLKDEIIAVETHFGINGANIVHIAGTETITGQKTFSSAILHADGTASLPGLAFSGDPDTGIYRVGANHIGFATNGALRWQINDTGDLAIFGGGTSQIYAANGTAVNPSYSFNVAGATDTGMYYSAADQIGFTAGGTLQWTISSDGNLTGSTGRVNTGSGTAANPAYTFFGDENSGMYRLGADELAWATGGTLRLSLSTAAFNVEGSTRFFTPDGSAAAPAWSFGSDQDSGIYRTAANTIGFSTGGTLRALITATEFSIQADGCQIEGRSSATASAPAFAFQGDPNTGIFNGTADRLSIAAGGEETFRFNAGTAVAGNNQDMVIVSGPLSTATVLRNRATANVTTSATTIATCDQICCLVFVTGTDGSNTFGDLVFTASSVATPVVVASRNSGTPAARTYTTSTTALQLAMASGTYDVTTFAILQRTGAF